MSFFRAGHAHAAVLLVLSIAILAVISYAALDGVLDAAAPRLACRSRRSSCRPGSSSRSSGDDPQRPNRLIVLLWAGAILLTAALITAGVGLIAGGVAALWARRHPDRGCRSTRSPAWRLAPSGLVNS